VRVFKSIQSKYISLHQLSRLWVYIDDEFHYVLQCPNFVTDRKNLIPKYIFNRTNTLKLSSLFNKKKPETVRKLCKLIDIINKKMSSP
jgi:hypothetical protein